jgi:PAS domain S-box-containing protein
MFELPSYWTKSVKQTAGLIVVGLSTAVLISWYIHFVPLIQIFPPQTPMHRMTALSFLLTGCALIFAGTRGQWITRIFALAVLVFSVAVCLEYALGADFGIDELLGPNYLNVGTSNPGRSSPVTSLGLIGASVALLVTSRPWLARFASVFVAILAAMLMAVGTLSLIGDMADRQAYGWTRLTHISLQSSAAFALLGVGLMSWAWQESRRAKKGTPDWLPLTLGVGLGTGALGVWRALLAHQPSALPMISGIILALGLLGALLVAITVAQTQQARKRSRELQGSNVLLQQIFDASPDGLLMANRRGVIIRTNERAERIFGYAHDELTGQSVERLIPEKFHDLHSSHWEGYHATPSVRSMGPGLELSYQRKDGSEFPVEIALSPVQSGNEMQVLVVVRDISERKRGEEILRQSEERFRSVFEQGPLGVSLMGVDGRMISVNSAFCRMLGYSKEELIKMSPLEITYPDDQDMSVDLMERFFQRDFPVSTVEKRYVRKNGEILWGRLTASVVRDQKNKPLYSVSLIEDITGRKRVEEELRLGNQIFANMEEGVCLVRLEDGVIVHANPKFEKMFGYGSDELTGTDVVAINSDASRHKHKEEVADEILVEVKRSGVWRGEILHHHKNETPFWCGVTVSIFHHPQFGDVGISIHQDITELKQSQEVLRESEERFRSLFEQNPMGVALLGTDHQITKANSAFCRMLGYSEAELTMMTPLDMTHPDDLKSCAPLLERLDKGEIQVCTMEKRYVKKNGELMWVSLTASVIRDQQGRPVHGLGMIEDITERRQAAQKLAEQAALLDLAHDAIIVRDLAGRIIFWNRGAEDTYGWSAEEAVGRVAHELLQTRFPIPLHKIEAAVLAQERWDGELEHTTRAGKTITEASRWSLRRDEHGAPAALLEINRDITFKRRAQEELRTLSERLRMATSTASIGVWDWDLRSNMSVWDDAMFEIFGIPKMIPMPYENFVRLIHPADAPSVEASLARAIQGKTQDSVEFRIIRPDGSVRHVSSAEGAVVGKLGNVIRVVGTAVDITERKQMEAQIEANKEQLVTSARLSALGMMAGGIAHEINNPLGIIHALASDLIDLVKEEGTAPPAMVSRNSTRIRETADRIARIIKSLRQISREGSSDKFQPAPIGKILEETLEVCRAWFKANTVKLLLPKHIPELIVYCREVQIGQILLNLLQNAFDAVVEQEGERWVRLDVTARDDSVVISVTDSGPGVPLELRPRIMEPFFTTKPVGKGTGLGLSLSKNIAEEHGGRLEYREDDGRTRFSLVLPMVRDAEHVWS